MRLIGLGRAMLLLAACCSVATAGEPPPKSLDVALREKLQPGVRDWVTAESLKLARTLNPQETAVRADIRTRFQGQALSVDDADRLTYLIVFGAIQVADHDLKTYVDQLKGGTAAKPAQATGSGPLVAQTTLSAPHAASGNVAFQPGPSPNGASSIGIGGVTVGSSGRNIGSPPPGALTLTPAQGMQLQNMDTHRNQLANLSNNLGRKIPSNLETLIQNLK